MSDRDKTPRFGFDTDLDRLGEALEELGVRLQDDDKESYLQSVDSEIVVEHSEYNRITLSVEYVVPGDSEVLQNPVRYKESE